MAWVVGLMPAAWVAASDPEGVSRTSREQVQGAVERAVGYLQGESATWLETRKCAACHHAGMPLWALSEAERHGFAIDEGYLSATLESLLGGREALLASKIFPDPSAPPDPRITGKLLNMGLPFMAIAARSRATLSEGEIQGLDLIAREIVEEQEADGSWAFLARLRRPPINESPTTDAAWIIVALAAETGPDASPERRSALDRAIAWFDESSASGLHQEKVLRVWLGLRLGRPIESMRPTIDEILALQRPDGGWSQSIPEPRSDAFATGQTLYVLSLCGFTAERPEIRRGIDFLVTTQSPDGSWPMASRSTSNGEPGSATLLTPITCAASSWATLALARLTPQEAVEAKPRTDTGRR